MKLKLILSVSVDVEDRPGEHCVFVKVLDLPAELSTKEVDRTVQMRLIELARDIQLALRIGVYKEVAP